MGLPRKIIVALLGLFSLPAAVLAAVIGGTYYAPQYDYREFFAAADRPELPGHPVRHRVPRRRSRHGGAGSAADDAGRQAAAGADLHLRRIRPSGRAPTIGWS